MTRNEALAALIKGVHADLRAFTYLKGLLEQQFSIALVHDGERMTQTVQSIETTVAALERSRRERMALLAVIAPRADRPSIEPALQALPERHRERLSKMWGELEKLVTQCRELNLRNGQLMASQQEIFRRVFDSEQHTYAPV